MTLTRIQERLTRFEAIIIPHLDEQAQKIAFLERRIAAQTAAMKELIRRTEQFNLAVYHPENGEAS